MKKKEEEVELEEKREEEKKMEISILVKPLCPSEGFRI